MLSTNSTSSIQKRRQHHRRQQSLEVPILATPLPTNNHRRHQPRAGHHRRGLSLDQSLSAVGHHGQPTGFRPLRAHDINGLPTGFPARTSTDHTNPAQPLDQQHYAKQETQEHSLTQPGLQQQQLNHPHPSHPQQLHAQEFASHLHQHMNGGFSTGMPTTNVEQAAAMQNLQSQLSWYQENFGAHPSQGRALQGPFMPAELANAQTIPPQVYMTHAVPQVSGLPCKTMPNTPQSRTGWPSPPPSRIRHSRSQSYAHDVNGIPILQPATSFAPNGLMYQNASFDSINEGYEPSAYSSSVADASSPQYQHTSSMPTVFEEDAGPMIMQPADALYLATAGAQDFNDPGFIIGGICQEQATLDQMGIDATYIETGTKESDLDAWLESPHGAVKYYKCKWDGCEHPQINRKENARSHVQNHLDDRKWRCNPCGKRFTRLHDLKRHALTHTNERPAICPCGKSFARQDALTRHRQRDMCKGVLPGFEKSDEDKPKRGRPKKSVDLTERSTKKTNRPDMDSRAQKAAMARRIDRANAAASADQCNIGSSFEGSSSSACSEQGMPDTPPQDSEPMDAVNFFDIETAVSGITAASEAWMDTPPSSPHSAPKNALSLARHGSTFRFHDSIAPAKLSDHSSPMAGDDFASSPFYGGSSPPCTSEPFYAASSPVARHDSIAGHSSPLISDAKLDTSELDLSVSHDSVLGHSSKDMDAVPASLSASANFSSFLSSVAFTGPTDFDNSGSCEIGADMFSKSTTALLESYPEAGEDAFSPPGDSHGGSSVYNYSDVDTVNDKIRHLRVRSQATVHQFQMPSQDNIRKDASMEDIFNNPFDDSSMSTAQEQIEAFLAGL